MKIKTLNLLILIMVLGTTQTMAQDKTPKENKIYDQYQNEIGIDFQNLLGSGTVGTGLIYKRRLKDKENISSNKHRALVFELYGSGTISLKKPADYDIGSMSSTEIRNIFNNTYFFTALIGMEWQQQRGRIQNFHGLQTGYRRNVVTTASSFFTNSGSQGNYFLELTKDKENTIPIYFYAGLKYFLTPRFSVSVDSKFRINLTAEFLEKKATGSDLVEDTKEKGPTSYKVNYFFDVLNTINFSYYF